MFIFIDFSLMLGKKIRYSLYKICNIFSFQIISWFLVSILSITVIRGLIHFPPLSSFYNKFVYIETKKILFIAKSFASRKHS